MSRARAAELADGLIGCVLILGVMAIGFELDHWGEMDAQCAQDGKTYSHTWRACKPKN